VSDQSTEKVFFEIGVGEDPKATNALTALAQQVEKAQQQMLSGVQAIEQAAKSAEAAVSRAGAAASKASVAGRPSMSFPAGTATMGNVPSMPRPPVSRMPAPFATVPAMSNVPSMGPASGRGTSSMPAPFATVPSNAFSPPPSSAPAGPSASVPPSPAAVPPMGSPSQSPGVGPDAVERMDKFAKSSEKAFKGVLDLGRGMALLGLVSEENSQKFLQSLVAIEGVVSTIKGGADLAEGLTGLMRGGAGRAAGAAAATGMAGGGGFLSSTVGGIAVGGAGTAAAAAAAIASVTLVAVEIKEIFSGTANQVGSVTDTIASWEVSLVSSLGELTGWFDLVGNAATKEAEAKSQLLKIEQERIDAMKNAELGARRSIEFGQAANNEEYLRFASNIGSGTDSPLQTELSIYADAVSKFAHSQKLMAEMAAAGAEGSEEYADQMARAEEYSAKIKQTGAAVVQLEKQAGKEKVDAAQKSIDMARQELDSRMKMLDALQEQRMTAAERFAALDDLQKGEAIGALRQAQTQGATSLSDQQRSILRSVGGDEANRFAREADIAEARQYGFDSSFGVGFDKQAARLEGEKARFQAVIQEQNQIIINVEDRNKQLVEAVVKEYAKVIQDSNREIERRVKEETQRRVQQINQNFTDQQRALKQAKG
jgi:hypothetical protein